MKLKSYIYMTLCLFILISCQDDDFKPDYSKGKAEANLNGEKWKGKGFGGLNNRNIGIDMHYSIYNSIGEKRQGLGFIKIPGRKGRYSLHKSDGQNFDSIVGANYRTLTSDGDAGENHYRIHEDENVSYVEVFSYDTLTGWLTGEFNAVFYFDTFWPKLNKSLPDTMIFENGVFEVKIE